MATKEPKFKPGDLVILRLGDDKELTRIEGITKFGDRDYYIVEGRDIPVPEEALEPYREEEEVNHSAELSLKFAIGDVVSVVGYPGKWKVNSFTVMTHVFSDRTEHEVLYMLENEKGEVVLQAYEEDMELVEQTENIAIEFEPQDRKIPTLEERIDGLLDDMNTYQFLYQLTKDAEYLDKYAKAKWELGRISRNAK